jgi:hypothetical protein
MTRALLLVLRWFGHADDICCALVSRCRPFAADVDVRREILFRMGEAAPLPAHRRLLLPFRGLEAVNQPLCGIGNAANSSE